MGLKRCGLWLLPLTCFSLAFPARVHAQEGRLLKLPFETVPKNILVTRGTLIEFNGLVNRAGDQQYYLQSNGQVCASGSFRDQWALDFDTSKMRSGYATVTLHAGAPGGANVLLARLHIAIAEKVPFTLNCLTDSLQPVDVVQLHLTAENHAAQKVELTLDNKPLVATLDAKGTVSFEPGDEQLGRHKIGGRVTAEDELVYELEPVSVDIVGKVRLLPLPVGNTLDLAAINGSIPLRCQTAPSVQVATVIYKLDAGVISEQHDGPFQSILWNPRRAPTGPHTLQVEVVGKDGKHSVSTPYSFQIVVGTPKTPPAPQPLSASAESTSSNIATGAKQPVRLEIPTDAKRLLQPVLLTVHADAGVQVRSVAYTVAGQEIPPDPTNPLTAFWDVRSEWPGNYSVTAVVTTQDNHTYRTTPVSVTVPVRVSALPILDKIEVTEKAKTLALNAVFVEGLKPVKADYEVDGKPMAVCEKLPFDAATIDVSDFDTGVHKLIVHVTDESGARYVSPSLTFDLVNKPLELAKKKEQAAILAEIEERKHIADYLRRKDMVGNALSAGRRSGAIGRANGLSVLTLDGEPIFGDTLLIDGAVSLGSGKRL